MGNKESTAAEPTPGDPNPAAAMLSDPNDQLSPDESRLPPEAVQVPISNVSKETILGIENFYRTKCDSIKLKPHRGVLDWFKRCSIGKEALEKGNLANCRFRDIRQLSFILDTMTFAGDLLHELSLFQSTTTVDFCEVVARFIRSAKDYIDCIRLKNNHGFGEGENGLKAVIGALQECRMLRSVRLSRSLALNDDRLPAFIKLLAEFAISSSILEVLETSFTGWNAEEVFRQIAPASPKHGIGFLFSTLSLHGSLLRLSIKYAGLDKSYASLIVEFLRTNRVLQELVLKGNSLGPEGLTEIAKGLEGNQGLIVLDLNANYGNEASVCAIMEAVSHHPTIRDIHVGMNGCKAPGIVKIAALLADPNSTIMGLDLSFSNIQGNDIKPLCDALITNYSITELNFSHCDLMDTGITHLAKVISSDDKIVVLNVIGNSVTESGLRALADPVKNSKSLKSCHVFDVDEPIHPVWKPVIKAQLEKSAGFGNVASQ